MNITEDLFYKEYKKTQNVGKVFEPMLGYIYYEYHYTPTEFNDQFPQFWNDCYYGKNMYEIEPAHEKYWQRLVDEYIILNDSIRSKKQFITKIL